MDKRFSQIFRKEDKKKMAKKLNVKRLNIVGHQGNSNKKHHEVFITHEQLRTVSRAERQVLQLL